MKKNKPVVLEKHQLDKRDKSFFNINFLEILEYQYFDAKIIINSF